MRRALSDSPATRLMDWWSISVPDAVRLALYTDENLNGGVSGLGDLRRTLAASAREYYYE